MKIKEIFWKSCTGCRFCVDKYCKCRYYSNLPSIKCFLFGILEQIGGLNEILIKKKKDNKDDNEDESD